MTGKKKKAVRRVWSATILLNDRPPGGKLPVDNKFLLKSEIQKICDKLEKSGESGYAGVAVSIVGLKLSLATKE